MDNDIALNRASGDIDFNALLDPADIAAMFNRPQTDSPARQPRKPIVEKDLANAKRSATSAATTIEKYFRKKIKIVQNGRDTHVTIYEAIILTLYTKAMTGDQKALTALMRYSKFGGNKSDSRRGVIALYEMDDGVYMQKSVY